MTRADHHPHTILNATQSIGSAMALVDAHVHLHPRYDLPAMFDGAASNIACAAKGMDMPVNAHGVLMLSESAGTDRFAEIMRRLGASIGHWQVHGCDENESLHLICDGQPRLTLIAGRQVVTRERLEVLALGTRRRIDDDQPIESVVQAARRAGALPVLPWGLGKWIGRRGRTIRRLIESPLAEGLFIGDNGGRPQHWPQPAIFEFAGQRGVRLLPGTDPLPIPRQQHRAGRYGFMLPLAADERRPCQVIRDMLVGQPTQPPIFGRRDGWLAFTAAQLLMQCHARMQRRRA